MDFRIGKISHSAETRRLKDFSQKVCGNVQVQETPMFHVQSCVTSWFGVNYSVCLLRISSVELLVIFKHRTYISAEVAILILSHLCRKYRIRDNFEEE